MEEEVHGIVIVGGGICGLATALALHRKGISSLVLEKSETLRTDGVAIGVHANGWRALDQLGLATELRETANIITGYHNVWQQQSKSTIIPARKELRCLKRKDLVQALAGSLPAGTIRFSCHIAAIVADPDPDGSNRTLLRTMDGSTIKANVLIGCDGANSVVAKYLGLGSPSHLPLLIMLGLTSYPHGHPFGTQFLRFAGNGFAVGLLPVTENLVHFFVSRPSPSTGFTDESAAREYVLEKLQDCPDEIADMVRRCDAAETKTLTKVWYRSPWQVLLGRFQRGTVTVAGDAMHVMGPYIGQGGSASLEDAVVLARTLSRSVPNGVVVVDGNGSTRSRELQEKRISVALGEYVRERRARLFMLSLESYVIGTLRIAKSLLKKLACVAMLTLLGSESRRHANYNCGPL
ncbi:monooxygenase 1-like [Miscanthus floridulus]|uniref:monooxygenase 1-like n=1 Tax=Miscanthus floridulus TaxID=154761 RepID=UPI00345945CF